MITFREEQENLASMRAQRRAAELATYMEEALPAPERTGTLTRSYHLENQMNLGRTYPRRRQPLRYTLAASLVIILILLTVTAALSFNQQTDRACRAAGHDRGAITLTESLKVNRWCIDETPYLFPLDRP